MTRRSTRQWDKALPFLLILVVVTLVSMMALEAFGGAENVRRLVADAGTWGPLVFIFLKVCTNVIAPLSGAPLIITGSVLFGVWEGLAYILIGDLVGSTFNFWIARLLGRPGIRRFVGKKAIKEVDAAVRHVGGWRALLVASLLLSALYDFVSYAAGLTSLKYRHFFWITLISCVPTSLIYLSIGSTFSTGPMAIYILTLLAAVIGAVVWVRRPRIKRR